MNDSPTPTRRGLQRLRIVIAAAVALGASLPLGAGAAGAAISGEEAPPLMIVPAPTPTRSGNVITLPAGSGYIWIGQHEGGLDFTDAPIRSGSFTLDAAHPALHLEAHPVKGTSFPDRGIQWFETFEYIPSTLTPVSVPPVTRAGNTLNFPSGAGYAYKNGPIVYAGPVALGPEYSNGNALNFCLTLSAGYVDAFTGSEWGRCDGYQYIQTTPEQVAPQAPRLENFGSHGCLIEVPRTTGVDYLTNPAVHSYGSGVGNVDNAGPTARRGVTVTLYFKAEPGYTLAPGSRTTWTFECVEFTDVVAGNQFKSEIEWLADQGVTRGWVHSDGSRTFEPLTPVKRDAMAAFLYRLAGSPTYTAPAVSPFTDVPTTNQFYKEIAWLSARGISQGWVQPDGSKKFEPLQSVNRDAMAAFLYRYESPVGYNAPAQTPFTDVTTVNQFYKEIAWLSDRGISQGWTQPDGSKRFAPLQSVNRDAMAAFMYRLSPE